MYKYIEVCVSALALAFISVAAFPTSENNETGPTITAFPKAHVRGVDADVGSRKEQTHERKKRAVTSASERQAILNAFNCRRSLVGASDMNYLTWNFALENDANTYLEKCDLEADYISTTDNADTRGGYLDRYAQTNDGHRSAVDYFFDSRPSVNVVTSKYLLHIGGGGYKFCRSFHLGGWMRSNAHFSVYAVTVSRKINTTIRQYTSGDPCTSCQPGVKWCYSKLCREDCSSSTPGCCPISNNMPAECLSNHLICHSTKFSEAKSGSSRTEVKASVMMLAIVSALRFCVL